MIIKQVSVTVENKEGKLKELMGILSENGISVEALSMAGTITRLIVPHPQETMDVLSDIGYEVHLTDVIRVRIPSKSGSFSKMLVDIAAEKINLEYMYAIPGGSEMIIRPSDVKRTNEILSDWDD